MSYQLLDSGGGQKLEQFGRYTFVRPSPAALWKPTLPETLWKRADATFSREGQMRWEERTPIDPSWTIELETIHFKLKRTEFGHLGLFPEQHSLWNWLSNKVGKMRAPKRILNLFAYTGGSTLVCAKAGAEVCHVDAAHNIVQWAKENTQLNGLLKAPIRWIVEDTIRFLKRLQKRGERFEGIILDPPSFGRGAKGELFKIERDLLELLELCFELLSSQAEFLLLSCHTEGYLPMMLERLLQQMSGRGFVESGHLFLPSGSLMNLPNGVFARWMASQ